jgi:hypothetical protein
MGDVRLRRAADCAEHLRRERSLRRSLAEADAPGLRARGAEIIAGRAGQVRSESAAAAFRAGGGTLPHAPAQR